MQSIRSLCLKHESWPVQCFLINELIARAIWIGSCFVRMEREREEERKGEGEGGRGRGRERGRGKDCTQGNLSLLFQRRAGCNDTRPIQQRVFHEDFCLSLKPLSMLRRCSLI